MNEVRYTVKTTHPVYGSEVFLVRVNEDYSGGFYADNGHLGCGKTRPSAIEAINELMFNNGREIVKCIVEGM